MMVAGARSAPQGTMGLWSTWTSSSWGPGCPASGRATGCRPAGRGRRYAVLEAREDLGGTWDLFRYPGVRSDSDMFTLGYEFKPWRDPAGKALADGPSILAYIRETAAEFGIDEHVRYSQKVVEADFSTAPRAGR